MMTIQRWIEGRYGWAALLSLGVTVVALQGCANQAERPREVRSLPDSKAACVRQKQTVVVGRSRYGQPIVLFTDAPCRAKP